MYAAHRKESNGRCRCSTGPWPCPAAPAALRTGYPAGEKGRERREWGWGGEGRAVRRKTSMSSLQLLRRFGGGAVTGRVAGPGTCQAEVGLKAGEGGVKAVLLKQMGVV